MAETEQDAQDRVIVVDGVQADVSDLTFREQRQLRDAIRTLSDNPDAQIEDARLDEFMPAIVYVLRSRNDPAYTLEQALEEKPSDVLVAKSSLAPSKRPTKRRTV